MFPFLISLGPIRLPSYGFFVASGYLAGIWWLKSRVKDMPGMTLDKFWVMIYGLFFGAIMGGKLLFVALNLPAYLSGDMRFFADFRYGFVFYGGFIGAAAMGLLVRRWTGLAYLPIADYFSVALPLGHAIGRVGCFAAGCCYGRPSGAPWAVAFGGRPGSNVPPELWGVPLHPTQLYESAANLAIAGLLLRWALPRARDGRWRAGSAFLAYIALYAAARFAIEAFRGDERGAQALGLSVSQWLALGGLSAAGAVLARRGPRPDSFR